ncbi:MAG: extracellular solute-binding protein [Armatimonadota bacterium]|nr:extracellular solute-binding protein [Armatimonadota bacterium]MDR7421051.1 extracellular solute-binding protein [Armatimonadota bacterium]MDR7456842.1 extracellular solute-binding protein [Armatimonadota bacterium]MDR7495509.1 extracellular solute-binding protein [Armatimonadota bacterium]MDR7510400.1 extracellular solute-binding protein [Armatimonadota bacterium]
MMWQTRWRTALVALVALVVMAAGPLPGTAGPALSGTLVVTSYGGPWEQFMRSTIVPGFQAEHPGVRVELAVGLSRDWIAKIRAAGKNDPPYDVVIANAVWVSAARLEGHFERLTEQNVPNLKDVWPELRNKNDVGVIFGLNPLGIGYRKDLVQNPPKRWTDLWNPEYRGRLGIYSINNSAGPMFIMLAAKLFANDPKNIEAGINKIKELRPFRQSDFSGDMEILLTRGEVHVGIIDAPAVSRLKRQGAPLEFVPPIEGMFMFEQDTNVTVGSKNKAAAFAFVNYMLSRQTQERWVNQYYLTPANRTLRFSGELAQLVPVHTAPQIRSIIKWDWDWFNTGAREQMIERWNREIVGR